MAAKKLAAFRLDPVLLTSLNNIKRREGWTVTEQVSRALRAWVESRPVRKPKVRRVDHVRREDGRPRRTVHRRPDRELRGGSVRAASDRGAGVKRKAAPGARRPRVR